MIITNIDIVPISFNHKGVNYHLQPSQTVSFPDSEFPALREIVDSVSTHGLKLEMEDAVIISDLYPVLQTIEQPVGILHPSEVTVYINDSTKTLTVSPTLERYVYYVQGKRVEIAGNRTVNWSSSHGIKFFYLDDLGQLQTTNSFSEDLITKYAIVAIIYWDATELKHIYFADERHGIQMSSRTHLYTHVTRGAAFDRGCKLVGFSVDGSGALDAHAKFSANSGSIWDEDIKISLPVQSEFPVLYLSGANNWKRKEADIFPIIYNGTVGYTGVRPCYNYFDGASWSLAEVDNNKFFLVHILATNDYEFPFMAILGHAQYDTKTEARDNAATEIKNFTGLPFAEFCPIGTVIFQVNDAYTNTVKAKIVSSDGGEDYEDHRSTNLRPGALA
jgi:hypothetical protein